MDILNKKIVISCHYLVYGAPQALRDYLMSKKVSKLMFIAHPLNSNIDKSYHELFFDGNGKVKKIFRVRLRLSLINYLIEFILNIIWSFKIKGKIDIFFGVDPLNCLSGVLLKKIGKIDKLVYYTIDYVPFRFKNTLLNYIYHRIDKFCLKNADETWNVSYRIAEGRESHRGLKMLDYPYQKVVPIGVWLDKVQRLPFDKIKHHQLLFIGNLLEKQGVQLVLDAIPLIIKDIPDFHFLIVGGGEYEEVLRSKVLDMGISQYVTFTGWVKDRNELDKMMADSAIAIAMYDKEKDNFTYYADPTKLKDYLSAGLPIILTDVPHNAYDIEKYGCGVVVDYDKNNIVKAILSLMLDKKALEKSRDNAINYIKDFEWGHIFENAINSLY